MKQRIREILINWVKVKEQFPAFNLCDDPFYHEKFQLLVEGRESLSNNSLGAFMEWSETIEIRWASKFEKGPLKPLDTFHTQLDSLSSIIYLMASKDYINDNQAATNLDVIVSGSLNALASAALDQLLRTLKRFPSADILEVLDEDLEREFGPDDMGRAELLILSLFELLEEYPDAVQSIFKGFFEPIVELSTATFSTLNVYEHYATSKAVQDAKGSQQREAANKKNEPNRRTREYAITLYNEKSWKSPRQASMKILELVKSHGVTVGFHFTDDFAAQIRIYNWLLEYKKNNQ